MFYINEAAQVRSWADLPRAIELSEGAGAVGQAHLLRALMSGRIALLPVMPETSATTFKKWTRLTAGRPSIALIGDDNGLNKGPGGWWVAERAVQWARSVLVHGAGAEIHHYEAALIAADLVQRMLIIECDTATLNAWIKLIKGAPNQPTTLVIKPSQGVHPVPLDRSRMQ